jgi:hypothetical protein
LLRTVNLTEVLHYFSVVHWFVQVEFGGGDTPRAIIGDCDLSVRYDGRGWHWFVRRHGVDMAEGSRCSITAAKQQAEATAIRVIAAV